MMQRMDKVGGHILPDPIATGTPCLGISCGNEEDRRSSGLIPWAIGGLCIAVGNLCADTDGQLPSLFL